VHAEVILDGNRAGAGQCSHVVHARYIAAPASDRRSGAVAPSKRAAPPPTCGDSIRHGLWRIAVQYVVGATIANPLLHRSLSMRTTAGEVVGTEPAPPSDEDPEMMHTSPRPWVAAFAALAVAIVALPAYANDDLTADKIVQNMLDQDPLGYGGAEARIAMVLVNDRNQENRRKLVMLSRKDGDTRRIFVRFQAPADVAGTSFLGIDEDGNRTQFLYLPSMGKSRRISGKQRNGSFVGTDYSYADMDNRDIDDSTKKKLADEKVGNQDCYVVEVVPSSKESAYSKITLWISKKTWLPMRGRFFDSAGTEVKRLTEQEVKKAEARWVITESKMVDLKRSHTTVMKVTEIDIKGDIPLEQFTERALARE
jgi:outer membrane lipoprotein-sorting protein